MVSLRKMPEWLSLMKAFVWFQKELVNTSVCCFAYSPYMFQDHSVLPTMRADRGFSWFSLPHFFFLIGLRKKKENKELLL